MISLNEARRLAIQALGRSLPAMERVDLPESLDRVLADDISSPEDMPAFHRSTVDGYAVIAADTRDAGSERPVLLERSGAVRMGMLVEGALLPGQAMRIPTGGMLPVHADAVVMQEYVNNEAADGRIAVSRAVCPNENVIRQGEDAAAGEVLLRRGRQIGPADLGVLSSCGVVKVPVFCKPRVVLIGTGDEIVAPSERPGPGQVRDVNTYTLGAMARHIGCAVTVIPRVADDPKQLREAIAAALDEADLILVSGGSSVGERDYTLTAVMQLPGAEILFHGIALKPGKPAALIRVGSTCIFGIPGHIVSAMTVFREIVTPAIGAMIGKTEERVRTVVKAELVAGLRPSDERDEFFYVRLESSGGKMHAVPIQGKSGWVTMLSRADGWVFLTAGHVGLTAGTEVEVVLLEGRQLPWGLGDGTCR